MALKPLDGARFQEFKKEEKRRSLGLGSAKGGPKYDTATKNVTSDTYDGSAAQAYGVADNSAFKITDRATSANSSVPMRGKKP